MNSKKNNKDKAWPSQEDSSTFVILHKADWSIPLVSTTAAPQSASHWQQKYGQSYVFQMAAPDGRELYNSLKALTNDKTPLYAVLYLPGKHSVRGKPIRAFTAWIEVTRYEEIKDSAGVTNYMMTYDFHEFPAPLYVRGNAQNLTERINWLSDPVQAFRGHDIRRISNEDFNVIIEEARSAIGELS